MLTMYSAGTTGYPTALTGRGRSGWSRRSRKSATVVSR